MAQKVAVYSPDGEKHIKTLPNARDLVAHAGWTWKPGKEYTPVDNAPYARVADKSDRDGKKKVQAILDSVGSGSGDRLTAADDADVAPEVEIIEDDAPEGVVETEVEAEAEADAPAPAARRGGRKAKA